MIESTELVKQMQAYNPAIEAEVVTRAYDYARKKHGEQIRASGEPYYTHPVEVAGSGASCHVGYRSCFYRRIPLGKDSKALEFTEKEKVFDPKVVYGDVPNPTQL